VAVRRERPLRDDPGAEWSGYAHYRREGVGKESVLHFVGMCPDRFGVCGREDVKPLWGLPGNQGAELQHNWHVPAERLQAIAEWVSHRGHGRRPPGKE
jgi:hypothetical protein